MRLKIFLLTLLSLLLVGTVLPTQAQTANDTIYSPRVLYSAMPRTYEIAGISVEGAPNYDDYLILAMPASRSATA